MIYYIKNRAHEYLHYVYNFTKLSVYVKSTLKLETLCSAIGSDIFIPMISFSQYCFCTDTFF